MSLAYSSVLSTVGLPLISAEAESYAFWTSPSLLSSFLFLLHNLDFSNYDIRRNSLFAIQSLRIPQFFYTYPVDPLVFPILPKIQTRFPGFGTYILLATSDYQAALTLLISSLSVRDDEPFDTPRTNFNKAVEDLQSLYNLRTGFFDQISWELSRLLVWGLYPPPIPI